MSLHDLLGPLLHPALHLGSTPTTCLAEAVAAVDAFLAEGWKL